MVNHSLLLFGLCFHTLLDGNGLEHSSRRKDKRRGNNDGIGKRTFLTSLD